ncbi:MAG: ATP-binding protein [Cyanobacteria bacterium]|nr:ATP-binding protein [Cyanobacteriota bacterium]
MNNAVKYTDEGGHIAVETAVEAGCAVLRVRDNGIGIAADLLPNVFDLFRQADQSLDRSQGGLGIGLTLVRLLVERHGGRVEVRGTVMVVSTVRLPLAARTPARSSERSNEPAPSSKTGFQALRILVIEDGWIQRRCSARCCVSTATMCVWRPKPRPALRLRGDFSRMSFSVTSVCQKRMDTRWHAG